MNRPMVADESAQATPGKECRVSERFPTDTPVSCQPPTATGGGDVRWPGFVRNVSAGGLCLILRRRFERGAALAIELPGTEASPPSTVFARVVTVKLEPGGSWALGCKFLSPLGEDELRPLLRPELAAEAAPAEPHHPSTALRHGTPANGTCVTGVYFRGVLPGGRVVKRLIKSLTVKTPWPLPAGRTIAIRFGGAANARPARVRVKDCRSADGRWHLDCVFIGPVPAGLLDACPTPDAKP